MILMLFYFKNDLSDNYFNGGLPFSGSQDKVRLINLSGNKFDGHIPPTIKGMKSLEILYLFAEPSVSSSEFAFIVPSKSPSEMPSTKLVFPTAISSYNLSIEPTKFPSVIPSIVTFRDLIHATI